jgi:hypothetical protein
LTYPTPVWDVYIFYSYSCSAYIHPPPSTIHFYSFMKVCQSYSQSAVFYCVVTTIMYNLPESPLQISLGVVLVVYILLGTPVSMPMARAINTIAGKGVLAVVMLLLALKAHPALGIISLIAGICIYKAAREKANGSLQTYYPTEKYQWSPFTSTNQFPVTLEEEEVRRMTSFPAGGVDSSASWTPAPVDNHGASLVDSSN